MSECPTALAPDVITCTPSCDPVSTDAPEQEPTNYASRRVIFPIFCSDSSAICVGLPADAVNHAEKTKHMI